MSVRFADIPKFGLGNYNADVPWGTLESWLEMASKSLTNNAINLDPDFQRGHVWTEQQQIGYVEFVIRGGQSQRVLYWNNPYYGSRKRKITLPDELVLVDGKQRLTAVRKFLANELRVFGHYLNEFEDPEYIMRLSGPAFRMNVNDLGTRTELLNWYIDLNDGGTVHTREEIDRVRNLLKAEIDG